MSHVSSARYHTWLRGSGGGQLRYTVRPSSQKARSAAGAATRVMRTGASVLVVAFSVLPCRLNDGGARRHLWRCHCDVLCTHLPGSRESPWAGAPRWCSEPWLEAAEPWKVPDTRWGSLCQLSFHVVQWFGGFFFFLSSVIRVLSVSYCALKKKT